MIPSVLHFIAAPVIKLTTKQDQFGPVKTKFTSRIDDFLGKFIQPIKIQTIAQKKTSSYFQKLEKPDLNAIFAFQDEFRPIEKFIKIRRTVENGQADPGLIQWYQSQNINGSFYGVQGQIGDIDLRKAFLQLVIEDIAEFQLHG